jgi:Tfp pilus assembly protein PilV
MDWIERWFGAAPDNGDGSLEILITLCVIAAGLAGFAYLHPRTRTYLATLAEEARQLSSKLLH